MPNTNYVCILASRSRSLYTGVTDNLLHRVSQHRQGIISGFTVTCRIFRLVYFEIFTDVHAANAREKQIKGLRREKEVRLVEFKNPQWIDLAEGLLSPRPRSQAVAGQPQRSKIYFKAGPSLRPASG